MKRAIMWALGVCLAVGVMGCGGGGDDGGPGAGKFEFVNNASIVVTVQPGAGESFGAFSINPGDSKTVKFEGDNINFLYTAGVSATRVPGENTVIFDD